MNKLKPKILFITSGPAAPGTSKEDNAFYFLSKYLDGDVLGMTWNHPDYLKYVESIQSSFGNFKYTAFRRSDLPSFIRNIKSFFCYLKLGSNIIKKSRPDIIISYGFLIPGITSSILSRIYKIPLIIEVPGVPSKGLITTKNLFSFLTSLFMTFSARFACKQAHAIWMLFPDQLKDKNLLINKKIFVFHEFTAISILNPTKVTDNIISFIGFPWKLKGVDILIKAFNTISDKHPTAKLKIAGYCTDRSEFEKLALPNKDKIEFTGSLEHIDALKFIEDSKIFVLPSRTEAMGRVLLEAMAAEKAVIGSRVDGIPHYLKDQETGLLFESENVEDLASKLDLLLNDLTLVESLGLAARKDIISKYNEEIFAIKFSDMIKSCLSL